MVLIQLVLALLLLLLLVSFWLINKLKRQNRQIQQELELLTQSSKELKQQQVLLQEAVHELRTGTLGVGNKVKELMGQLQQTQNKQIEMESSDPGNKLYTKAAKLVEQGYSIEDLMQECELPRAEAELLFNLHKR